MSTEADFANARRLPPIPPPPPHRPAAAPEQDPHTAVLRPVPDRPASPPPAVPQPPAEAPPRSAAAEPPVPPRPPAPPQPPTVPAPPQTPPPAPAPLPVPPPPAHAPVTPPPAQPTSRPAAYRDTAAFHLANSEALWVAPQPSGPPGPRTPLPPKSAAPGAPRATPAHRPAPRTVAVAACLVLGLGLIGGAAAGSWLTDGPDDRPAAEATFERGRQVWHSVPVDELFPRTLKGPAAGPGGADRSWTRIAVAPDSGCADAFDPLLAKVLSPVGCTRLLRATYLDATHTSLITTGALVTKADATGMKDLRKRFTTEKLATRRDLMPRPYAAKGTVAQGFGPAQRASWSVSVLTDIPVVLYAVSGFADGREITAPEPAETAAKQGATTETARSGLGHDAKGVADQIARIFRDRAAGATEAPS